MPLTQADLEKVGRMLSDKYGIRVVCGGNECKTDGKTIYLPTLPKHIDNPKLLSLVRFFLDHECGHIVGNSDVKRLAAVGKAHGVNAAAVLDTLEDVRVEQIMADVWSGCGVNLAEGSREVLRRLEAEAGESTEHPVKQLMTAIYTRAKRMPYPKWVPHEVRQIVENHAAELQHIPDWAASTADLEPLALRLCDELDYQPPEQPEDEDEDSDGDDGNGTEWEDLLDRFDPSKMAAEAVSEEFEADNGTFRDRHNDDDAPWGMFRPIVPNLDTIEDWEVPDDVDDLQRKALRRAIAEAEKAGGAVRQRLAQLLMVEAKSYWRGGRKRGRPDASKLAALAVGTSERVLRQRVEHPSPDTACMLLLDGSGSMGYYIDETSGTERIHYAARTAVSFAHTLSMCGHATEVAVFQDWSGGGKGWSRTTKLYGAGGEARRAMLDLFGPLAGEGNQRINIVVDCAKDPNYDGPSLAMRVYRHGMPYGLRMAGVRLVRAKRFDEPYRKKALEIMSLSAIPSGRTPMAVGMLMAADELSARRERRKVMIVLCDGEPSLGGYAKWACRHVERLGIELVLVGMGVPSERLAALHDKYATVHDPNNLCGATMEQLTEALHPGTSLVC